MCDPIDVFKDVAHIVVNPIDFGLSKIGLGSPVGDKVENALGLNGPDVPALPPLAPPPPPPPDPGDELVQRARAAQARRQLMSQGIGSTFLTGPMGLSTPAPTATPGLLGS